jgi:hypothetical protein
VGGLALLDTVPSGGAMPVNVALHGRLAYVLDAAGNDIAGFTLGSGGLKPIPGDVRALFVGPPGPPRWPSTRSSLLVTEKASSTLDPFPVDARGVAGRAHEIPSVGSIPYGFAYSRTGVAVVSDAADSALTTYVARGGHPIRPVEEVADGQGAACWVAVARDGVASTTNAHSGNLSSYRVRPDGRLRLLRGVAAVIGGAPIELALSPKAAPTPVRATRASWRAHPGLRRRTASKVSSTSSGSTTARRLTTARCQRSAPRRGHLEASWCTSPHSGAASTRRQGPCVTLSLARLQTSSGISPSRPRRLDTARTSAHASDVRRCSPGRRDQSMAGALWLSVNNADRIAEASQ